MPFSSFPVWMRGRTHGEAIRQKQRIKWHSHSRKHRLQTLLMLSCAPKYWNNDRSRSWCLSGRPDCAHTHTHIHIVRQKWKSRAQCKWKVIKYLPLHALSKKKNTKTTKTESKLLMPHGNQMLSNNFNLNKADNHGQREMYEQTNRFGYAHVW